MIRAIRLELARPIGEDWTIVGPLMRSLSRATPKLLNAALDAKIAIGVAGRDAVKAAVAPDARAASGDGLAYQAVLRGVEGLRAWAEKKPVRDGKPHPWADLQVPGGMASQIARAACQAFARRDQEPPRFSSERILVRATEVELGKDERGVTISVKLRPKGLVKFAVAGSRGAHHDVLDALVSKAWDHGDCKIQWDERRSKWYALVSYERPAATPVALDPNKALIVHRGIRNALYLVSTDGWSHGFSGSKFVAQRRALQARIRDMRRVSPWERGDGSKGHGKARHDKALTTLGDKLARVTHTWCQQAAAYVSEQAKRLGCGHVVIEEYGGIEPDPDPQKRRVLDRFPLYDLKLAIASVCEREGLTLGEAKSAWISSTCPRCGELDARSHNHRTGIFRCRACEYERPADFVAAIWMGRRSGVDMTVWDERFRRERELVESMRKTRDNDGEQTAGNDVRGDGRAVQATARKTRASRGRVLRVSGDVRA